MDIRVFQSDKGDCMLLSGADGTSMLVDGGMSRSYKEHVSPALGALRQAGRRLGLVYVSHIDQDHIAGVLQLMDDEVEWRVHEHHLRNGNANHPVPERQRPPVVQHLWHNAFHEQLSKNAGEIADMLAATATILSGAEAGGVTTALTASEASALRAVAENNRDLATSVSEAIRLSRRVGPNQLGIELNAPAGGRLMMVREDETPVIEVGSLRVRVIAPFEADLKTLRTRWNKWLRDNKAALARIREQARADERDLRASGVDAFLAPLLAQAKALGNRKQVTPPNLASLMLLVEEGTTSALLTGDGHAQEILAGLRRVGRLGQDGGGTHVTVFKVPHHGAAANTTPELCRTVTADHYIFCGNGEHENPELDVIQAYFDARCGPDDMRTQNPDADGEFTFWFSSSSEVVAEDQALADHMGDVEDLVAALVRRSQGRMHAEFLTASSMDVRLPRAGRAGRAARLTPEIDTTASPGRA